MAKNLNFKIPLPPIVYAIGSQKIEKKNNNKKKRVKFADDVKDSRGNSELYRKLHRKSSKAEATCRGNEILGYNGRMPANRVALYSGILKDRVQKIGYSYWLIDNQFIEYWAVICLRLALEFVKKKELEFGEEVPYCLYFIVNTTTSFKFDYWIYGSCLCF